MLIEFTINEGMPFGRNARPEKRTLGSSRASPVVPQYYSPTPADLLPLLPKARFINDEDSVWISRLVQLFEHIAAHGEPMQGNTFPGRFMSLSSSPPLPCLCCDSSSWRFHERNWSVRV